MRWTYLLVVVLHSFSGTVRAAIIDDFSAGALMLRTDTNATKVQQTQTNLDPLTVFGGTRAVSLWAPSASLEIAPTAGEMIFRGESGRGYFTLDYTSKTPINLLADGSDAFVLNFSELILSGITPLDMYVRSYSGWNQGGIVSYITEEDSGAKSLIFPFSRFMDDPRADFTSIFQIRIDGFRITTPSQIGMSSIETVRTVPEPNVSLLAVAGLAFLVHTSRTSRHSSGHQAH